MPFIEVTALNKRYRVGTQGLQLSVVATHDVP
jgi:hypothetical protein